MSVDEKTLFETIWNHVAHEASQRGGIVHVDDASNNEDEDSSAIDHMLPSGVTASAATDGLRVLYSLHTKNLQATATSINGRALSPVGYGEGNFESLKALAQDLKLTAF